MAKRPPDSRPVYVTPDVYERLHAAADERLVGVHLLADRLLSAAVDDLTPVDVYGRLIPNAPLPDVVESAGAARAGDPESAR
jgi:hypothetical protein